MKRNFLYLALFLFSIVGLTACDETYPMSWSPDGTKLAMVTADGLRLSDADGKLSAPLTDTAKRFVWTPDSNKLLLVGEKSVKTWSEVKFYLSEDQQKEVIDLAAYMKQRMATGGKQALDNDPKLEACPGWLAMSTLVYLRDTDRDSLKPLIESDKPDSLNTFNVTIWQLNLLTVSPNIASTSKEIWRGLFEIENVCIAPNGKFAVIAIDKKPHLVGHDLLLLSLDVPQAPMKVADAATTAVDWTTDSRSLVFTPGPCGGKDCPEVGRICTIDVLDAAGNTLTTPQTEKTLLYTMSPAQALQSLPDKRIIFDSAQVELPATESDLSKTATLYSFKTDDQVVRRLMAHQDIEAYGSVKSLSANPSGTRLAIKGSNSSATVDIPTGQSNSISIYSDLQPCWRNDDEVCFAKPVDKVGSNKHAAEIVLHSISKGTDRILSKDWPSSAVNGMLIDTSKK